MRLPNAFQAQTPIGAAIANLGSVLFSGPSPIEQQQIDADNAYRRAQTDYATTNADAVRAKMAANARLAGLLAQYGTGDLPAGADRGSYLRQGFSDIAGNLAEGDNLSQIGQLFRAFVANTNGTNDGDLVRGLVGAGGTIGVNDAVSLPGQEAVAARNATNERVLQAQKDAADMQRALAVVEATPLTRPQVEGQLLQNMLPGLTEAQRLVVVGAQGPYKGDVITDTTGNTYRIDTNDPFAIASPIPMRVPLDPGPGAHPTGPSVGLAPLTVDTAPNDPASRRARDLQAASMGITLQELDFLDRVDQMARNNIAGYSGLPKELRDSYDAIIAKVRSRLPSVGSEVSAELPAGYTVIP